MKPRNVPVLRSDGCRPISEPRPLSVTFVWLAPSAYVEIPSALRCQTTYAAKEIGWFHERRSGHICPKANWWVMRYRDDPQQSGAGDRSLDRNHDHAWPIFGSLILPARCSQCQRYAQEITKPRRGSGNAIKRCFIR